MLNLDRRSLLRFGTVQLGGLALASTAGTAAQASPTRPRARACILLFMDGGPSHIDLFDLKPDAPSEIRGPFSSIPTTVSGTHVCEHLPRVARQMHRIAQVRSVRHEEMVHDPAVYQTLTGRKHPSSRGDLVVDGADFPQVGTAFGVVNPRPGVMPPVIELPETMRMGARILPGQNAGFLGPTHDPFRVTVTPEAEVIKPEVELSERIGRSRLARRSALLGQLDGRLSRLRDRAELGQITQFQQQALQVLSQPRVHEAFDLEREPAAVRERYGRHRHGQSALLARRLVEAGAQFVTVYWGKEPQDWADGQGKRIANNPWDTHRNHFPLTKDELLPRADQTLSALIEDLHARGMLDETLVVWMGEFGRSPRISEWASREHWPYANTILMAGAGVPGGAVYGATDRTASEVVENPVSPADITATILHALGVDPRSVIHDPGGRPYPLSEGAPIRALVG